MCHTDLFHSQWKEVSPNLRLTLVTKAFLFPTSSFPIAAGSRMALPSKASFPISNICLSLAHLTPSSWLGAHMGTTTFPLLSPTALTFLALNNGIYSSSKYLWSAS